MKTAFTLSLVLLALCAGVAFPQESSDDFAVVDSYQLEASFSPDDGTITACAVIDFKDLPAKSDNVVFYLHDELKVESVTGGDGIALAFEQDRVNYVYNYSTFATRVVVDVGSVDFEKSLEVKYSGRFSPNNTRAKSDYMRIDSSGVFLRSYGYTLWFPVFIPPNHGDPLVTFDQVKMETPESMTAVFVGTRKSERVSNGKRISEWSVSDVRLTSVQCTAQEFNVHRQGESYIYSRDEKLSADAVNQIITFTAGFQDLVRIHYGLDETIQQTHVVEMPQYGDISSGNMIGLDSEKWRAFGEDDFAKQTLAHEFIHPFVHVPVPKKDPLCALIMEGFPSYFHWPILAELTGEENYNDYLDRVQEAYLEKKKIAQISNNQSLPMEKPISQIEVEEIGVYKDRFVLPDRALLFLDFLRRKMGKAKFLEFSKKLFRSDSLDSIEFCGLVDQYLPHSTETIKLWLNTNDYPDRIRRSSK